MSAAPSLSATTGHQVTMLSPLTRLTLRRERRSVLAWALGTGLLSLYCVVAFTSMYTHPRSAPPPR